MWQFRLLGDGGDEILRAATLREMQRVHWVDPDWETTWGLGFAVSRDGEIVLQQNTRRMFRGLADSTGRFEVKTWAD